MIDLTAKELNEKLILTPKNAGEVLSQDEIDKAYEFCEQYKNFLDEGKTEREVVSFTEKLLIENGFEKFDRNKKYTQGDKVYYNNRHKAIIMAVIGSEDIQNGVHMMASHIDAPRIDMKPRPLYEEAQLALFKTHYYGGLKKYQWTAIPLSLHGVICKKDGTKVTVNIGENENDPAFCITDLLPHLSKDQVQRKLSEGIKGEELNLLVGSMPFKDDEVSQKVKLNIMKILNEKYGIVESDFISAELQVVPAFKARDIGFDRSLIGAYAQDDRVCAFTTLMATLNTKNPTKTIVTVLADKEEVGSDGNTGLNSAYLRYFIADLAKPYNVEARTVLSNSTCLSADVTACMDPTFADVLEKNNCAYANYGVALAKYTGSRGKSGTSDASAEFVGEVISILEKEDVVWQMAELGKVDQGGGGTVAMYVASLNVDVVDIGVPVLSMHSPFEVTSKLDVYMAYKAFCAYAKSK